jgi:hypothetical protein
MQLDFDDERDGARRDTSSDVEDEHSSEPVSLSDLEMIMAPRVAPPPLTNRADPRWRRSEREENSGP